MKISIANQGSLSNGELSTLDRPPPIAAAHRARGAALREMASALLHRLRFFRASSPLLSSRARDIVPADGPRRAGLLPMALATLAIWHRRSRTRRHLVRLDARHLDDTGLTRAQQRVEAGKWFWQA